MGDEASYDCNDRTFYNISNRKIFSFIYIWLMDHGEPCNEVGSLSPVEYLMGFEPGTFPLGHSPIISIHWVLSSTFLSQRTKKMF